ncbi:UDP-GalNAc:beta-1,3-N-acetylgalactosaminyltransferase 2-like [Babylonia areolata]|uniref:UDP-GalNAc:beta-1, 3-N-acetylgalactosaminyltransferase 2-like n=1 Tax=Babylonia areolata TaxID=304850 RepID=UPI003FD56A36
MKVSSAETMLIRGPRTLITGERWIQRQTDSSAGLIPDTDVVLPGERSVKGRGIGGVTGFQALLFSTHGDDVFFVTAFVNHAGSSSQCRETQADFTSSLCWCDGRQWAGVPSLRGNLWFGNSARQRYDVPSSVLHVPLESKRRRKLDVAGGARNARLNFGLLSLGTHLEIALNSKHDDVTTSTPMTSSPDGSSSSATYRHNVYRHPGPAVLLVEGMREDGTIIKGHNSSVFSVVSFMYAVHDTPELQRHSRQRAQRQAAWRARQEAEVAALRAEEEVYGDILWVDGVDVYRSLPAKLLHCHHWFSQEFAADHVMKTDDDSLVDLGRVADMLAGQPLVGKQWWGSFRREWAVERVGKWREEDYPPSLYPPFACGSGSVLSRGLHLWLAANRPHLHSFQGEDVSLGIWLAPLAPSLLHDSRWQCFSLCQDGMLSMPDLTPQQLTTRWNQSLHCATPCSAC